MKRKMKDNITLNAYLVMVKTEEIRRKQFKLCKDADIDVLSNVWLRDEWVVSDHKPEIYKQMMIEAAEYGLELQTREERLQTALTRSDEEIISIAKEYKDIRGFGGFYVTDEPRNPNPYARIENALRSVCPDTRVNVNFLPCNCYREGAYIRQLTDYAALLKYGGTLSLDTYNFDTEGGVNEDLLFGNYEYLRYAEMLTDCDTAMYIQSVGSPEVYKYRRPSPSDIRYNMMAALAYGIKEIKFFTWGTPPEASCLDVYTSAIIGLDLEPTDLYIPVCKINRDAHAIGKYIAACDAKEVWHTKGHSSVYRVLPQDHFVSVGDGAELIVSLMKERYGEHEYIMLVNKDFKQEQSFTCSVRGADALEILNKEIGEFEPIAIENGQAGITLEAGDATLIRLPRGNFIKKLERISPDLAREARVSATGSIGDGEFYTYNVYDGIYDGRGTRLCGGAGKRESITFDIGESEKVSRVDVYPRGIRHACGANYPDDIEIELSLDGETFKTVYKTAKGEIERPIRKVPVFRFEPTEAKYIRVSVGGYSERAKYFELGNICIYNEADLGDISDDIPTFYAERQTGKDADLALDAPVVDYSSATDEPSWGVHYSYITDGTEQGWASVEKAYAEGEDNKEWITLDLLETYKINKVVLVPQTAQHGHNVFPEEYTVELSVDGQSFAAVKSVTGDRAPKDEKRVLEFEPTDARYVRFVGHKQKSEGANGAAYCIELCEIEVYGEK